MRIESMTATFGKLQGETLTLSPGLNILELPNEQGKSTWCAFLLSMLYGVDTSERETRSNFPLKKHYAPWSGKAMEGKLQLVHEGRHITIERSSTARAPLGVFRAFDTQSGRPIPELTGQNCGQMLLGVPRQVFERSAFLRQDGMAIQMEASLEQRLGALVTTGDESISYQEAERLLRERRNRCRHNKTGLIPQAQTALEGVKERLSRLHALHETLAQARLEEQQAKSSLRILRLQLEALQSRQAQQSRAQLERAKGDAAEKIEHAKALQAECAALPPVDVLQTWERELSRLMSLRHTLTLDAASLPQPEAEPALPQPFAGLKEEAITAKAHVDAAQMCLLQAAKKPAALGWLLPAAALLLGAGALALSRHTLPALLAGLAGLFVLAFGGLTQLKKRQTWQKARNDLQTLQRSYGVQTPEELEALASRCRELQTHWEASQNRRREELSALQERKMKLDKQCQAFLDTLNAQLGSSSTMEEAGELLHRNTEKQLLAEAAHRSAETAFRSYHTLKEALGTMPAAREPQVPIPEGLSLPAVQAQILAAEEKLRQLRSIIDRGEGQSSTLGDPIELEAKQQQLTARLEALNEEYDALSIALTALGKANEALQNRFAPQLTTLAADYLSRLTDGAYSQLLLDQNLRASLYPAQAPASREAAYFSSGTRDQLYFAVRLGVSRLLVPESPLILDDALVRFDDKRLQKALEVLEQEAQSRQILLFTCQSREKAMLQ